MELDCGRNRPQVTDIKLQLSKIKEKLPNIKKKDIKTVIQHLNKQLKILHQNKLKKMDKYIKIYKGYYDFDKKDDKLNINDKVLYFLGNNKNRKDTKLRAQFSGPFTIIKRINSNVVRIQDNKTKHTMAAHTSMLKKYKQSEYISQTEYNKKYNKPETAAKSNPNKNQKRGKNKFKPIINPKYKVEKVNKTKTSKVRPSQSKQTHKQRIKRKQKRIFYTKHNINCLNHIIINPINNSYNKPTKTTTTHMSYNDSNSNISSSDQFHLGNNNQFRNRNHINSHNHHNNNNQRFNHNEHHNNNQPTQSENKNEHKNEDSKEHTSCYNRIKKAGYTDELNALIRLLNDPMNNNINANPNDKIAHINYKTIELYQYKTSKPQHTLDQILNQYDIPLEEPNYKYQPVKLLDTIKITDDITAKQAITFLRQAITSPASRATYTMIVDNNLTVHCLQDLPKFNKAKIISIFTENSLLPFPIKIKNTNFKFNLSILMENTIDDKPNQYSPIPMDAYSYQQNAIIAELRQAQHQLLSLNTPIISNDLVQHLFNNNINAIITKITNNPIIKVRWNQEMLEPAMKRLTQYQQTETQTIDYINNIGTKLIRIRKEQEDVTKLIYKLGQAIKQASNPQQKQDTLPITSTELRAYNSFKPHDPDNRLDKAAAEARSAMQNFNNKTLNALSTLFNCAIRSEQNIFDNEQKQKHQQQLDIQTNRNINLNDDNIFLANTIYETVNLQANGNFLGQEMKDNIINKVKMRQSILGPEGSKFSARTEILTYEEANIPQPTEFDYTSYNNQNNNNNNNYNNQNTNYNNNNYSYNQEFNHLADGHTEKQDNVNNNNNELFTKLPDSPNQQANNEETQEDTPNIEPGLNDLFKTDHYQTIKTDNNDIEILDDIDISPLNNNDNNNIFDYNINSNLDIIEYKNDDIDLITNNNERNQQNDKLENNENNKLNYNDDKSSQTSDDLPIIKAKNDNSNNNKINKNKYNLLDVPKYEDYDSTEFEVPDTYDEMIEGEQEIYNNNNNNYTFYNNEYSLTMNNLKAHNINNNQYNDHNAFHNIPSNPVPQPVRCYRLRLENLQINQINNNKKILHKNNDNITKINEKDKPTYKRLGIYMTNLNQFNNDMRFETIPIPLWTAKFNNKFTPIKGQDIPPLIPQLIDICLSISKKIEPQAKSILQLDKQESQIPKDQSNKKIMKEIYPESLKLMYLLNTLHLILGYIKHQIDTNQTPYSYNLSKPKINREKAQRHNYGPYIQTFQIYNKNDKRTLTFNLYVNIIYGTIKPENEILLSSNESLNYPNKMYTFEDRHTNEIIATIADELATKYYQHNIQFDYTQNNILNYNDRETPLTKEKRHKSNASSNRRKHSHHQPSNNKSKYYRTKDKRHTKEDNSKYDNKERDKTRNKRRKTSNKSKDKRRKHSKDNKLKSRQNRRKDNTQQRKSNDKRRKERIRNPFATQSLYNTNDKLLKQFGQNLINSKQDQLFETINQENNKSNNNNKRNNKGNNNNNKRNNYKRDIRRHTNENDTSPARSPFVPNPIEEEIRQRTRRNHREQGIPDDFSD